jgi:S1-C subfamily serine protease
MRICSIYLRRFLVTAFIIIHFHIDTRAEESKPSAPEANSSTVEKSVVKIFSTKREPNLSEPWTKQAPEEMTGSGVVISGKRILTNAHVVLYSTQVRVQANQASDKISATVVAITPSMDLAILKLEDESFFDSHPPVTFSSAIPTIKEAVMAYGYPTGGTSLSITKGIVSRIEFTDYEFSTKGLRIQIDAAINPGNSGGPVLVDDQMIGIAFSHLGKAQNIGYIIPNEEIKLFLQDVEDGRYDGKPAMYDELQTLENSTLRSFLKLDKSTKGIVVHYPFETDSNYPLQQWDVITKIGDTPIDDLGMITLNANLRVHFQYLIQNIAKNGKVPLTIFRKGKEISVEFPAIQKRPMLIPSLLGTYPSYFIYGPMVFSDVNGEHLNALLSGSSAGRQIAKLIFMGSPLLSRRFDKPAFDGEGLVLVSRPFFPHKLSNGYDSPTGAVVKTINGTAIKNFQHFIEVLRDSQDEYITFEFETRGFEAMVFPRKEIMAATDEILTDNGIRSQGSSDALAIWNAKSK